MKQRVQKVSRSERTQYFTSLTAKEHSMMDALNPINPEHINEESLLPIYIYNFENQEIMEQTVRLVYLSQIKGKSDKVVRSFEGLMRGVFGIDCDNISDDIPYKLSKEEVLALVDKDRFYTNPPAKVEHTFKPLTVERE